MAEKSSLGIDLYCRYIFAKISCAFTDNGEGGDVYISSIPRLGDESGERVVGLIVSFGPGKADDNS